MPLNAPVTLRSPPRAVWALLTWAVGACALMVLDGPLEVSHLSLMLVLISALASLWSSPWAAVLASGLAVLWFNYAVVPPQGSVRVDWRTHGWLLLTLAGVNGLVALLMARQRAWTAQARQHLGELQALQALGEHLRSQEDPGAHDAFMRGLLARAAELPEDDVVLLRDGAEGQAPHVLGRWTEHERLGLMLCLREARAMGPGTGWHEEQDAWFLPCRGQRRAWAAVLLRVGASPWDTLPRRRHLQALCDQYGQALDRADGWRHAVLAREAAQIQTVRNTLLAAIAHDHRTPLATILSAASSLRDQGERLSSAQQQALAHTIVGEAGQLIRLTENTLQLARLDSPARTLHTDWESAEELIGALMGRLRNRGQSERVRVRVEPGLPLLRCDAVLIGQLLDNLVDNAMKYGDPLLPVEVVARRQGDQLLLAVRDRGPGVPLALRERIFEAFQRGASAATVAARGTGLGLALCSAIARAHGATLKLRPRPHGGSAFELWWPMQPDVTLEPPPLEREA